MLSPGELKIMHAYRLSHGELRDNDDVSRSRQIRRYNNSPLHVTGNMAAAPDSVNTGVKKKPDSPF